MAKFDIGVGLLGGLGGAASAYSEAITDNQKVKYEDQKAKILYDRQMSLKKMDIEANENTALQKQEFTEENAATAQKYALEQDTAKLTQQGEMASKERDRLRAEAKADEYAVAKREASMHPDFPEDPVAQEAFIKKVADNKWLSKQLATKGIDKTVQVQLIKSADEAWLNMDEDAKEKLIKRAGGDEVVAKGRYAAKNVASWKSALGIKKPSRINPDRTPEEVKVAEEAKANQVVGSAGNRKEALKLLTQAKTPEAKAKLMAVINKRYPEVVTPNTGESGLQKTVSAVTDTVKDAGGMLQRGYTDIGKGMGDFLFGDEGVDYPGK